MERARAQAVDLKVSSHGSERAVWSYVLAGKFGERSVRSERDRQSLLPHGYHARLLRVGGLGISAIDRRSPGITQ